MSQSEEDVSESVVSSNQFSSEFVDDADITTAAVQKKLEDLVSQLNNLKKVKAEIQKVIKINNRNILPHFSKSLFLEQEGPPEHPEEQFINPALMRPLLEFTDPKVVYYEEEQRDKK